MLSSCDSCIPTTVKPPLLVDHIAQCSVRAPIFMLAAVVRIRLGTAILDACIAGADHRISFDEISPRMVGLQLWDC